MLCGKSTLVRVSECSSFLETTVVESLRCVCYFTTKVLNNYTMWELVTKSLLLPYLHLPTCAYVFIVSRWNMIVRELSACEHRLISGRRFSPLEIRLCSQAR